MVKILVIKVNPIGTSNLFLDVEENKIKDARTSSTNRHLIEVESKGAVTKELLHRELEIFKPDILHISGHGSEEGVLYFHDEGNHKKELSLDMFGAFIQNYKPNLKCVFLNACFSLMKTEEFRDIDNMATIGMKSEVPNDTALTFSEAFYTSFFEGRNIQESFDSALGVVGLDNFGDENIPVIIGQTDLRLQSGSIATANVADMDIIPKENFDIARDKERRRKRQYHMLIGIVILVVLGLAGTSLYYGNGIESLLGITPLGAIIWIKDKLDNIEDSLTLLKMLENEVTEFLVQLQNPPVPNADETITNLKQQFWNIVN